MGPFDPNHGRELAYGRGEQAAPRIPPVMDRTGGGVSDLADRFSGLGVRDVPNDNLLQAMRAMDAAENIIKQQSEENNQLKSELARKAKELERYRLQSTSAKPSSEDLVNERDMNRWIDNGFLVTPPGMSVIHHNGIAGREETSLEAGTVNQHYYENNHANGALRNVPGAQSGHNNVGPSQFSTPSSRSVSPNKHRKEVEYDMRFNLAGNGLVPTDHLWKHDLMRKSREHEEEIAQLRKHLADYSEKEAQIRSEKYVLQERITYMRMAFDQQQQDLVAAASKAISYRQEIIEENIRLTNALQAAQAERSTFVSSLLPLLSEYHLEPPAHDAQSIVIHLKVLFRHMQEKLIIAEEKLRESQYQLAPWHAETSNNTEFPTQSPLHHPITQKSNLEIVPQTTYQHAHSPMSSPPNVQTRYESDVIGNLSQQAGPSGVVARNLGHDNLDKKSLSASRNTASQDASIRGNQSGSHVANFAVEPENQNQSFQHHVVIKTEDSYPYHGANFTAEPENQNVSSQHHVVTNTDDSEITVAQHGREPSVHWAPGNSPYLPTGQEDPNSYPYLPPVLEEPSSSFSEAADDDPLPAIEGLQISGEAYPGRELKASGFSINGTTSCNFEWVRYLEDGSMKYIDGARQPMYLVTADDVDSYLAIQIQPLDDRNRKGELVKVFANSQRKITCDPEAQEQIKNTVAIGNVSYEVLLSARYLDIWEPAILAIKRDGYSIKCNGRVVVEEKFKQSTNIIVPYGQPSEFEIQEDIREFVLKTTENGRPRDTIVLTMRLFKLMAVEKRKRRKKGLFFKS